MRVRHTKGDRIRWHGYTLTVTDATPRYVHGRPYGTYVLRAKYIDGPLAGWGEDVIIDQIEEEETR
jgi:hypothetical protein